MPTLQASLRIIFKNVLVPTDFTAASAAALAYARAFSRDHGSKIFVAHAVTPEPPVFLPMEPIPLALDSTWQDAQAELNQFLSQDVHKDTKHEGILERGQIWNVVDDVVHRHAIDLIVLGSHGKRGLKKFVLGSAAEEIFRQADCPVLTVGPKVAPPVEEATAFQHIVFATDFSAGSLKALPYAISLAEENQARLTLLHVIPLVPLQQQAGVTESTADRLQKLIPPDAEDWCHPVSLVSFEFPAEGILHVADSEEADLIVMGVHKRAPHASAHLPWAIAYDVICKARCPVLTVRG
jgi:nucleotide-binding universal stress UspA family protein